MKANTFQYRGLTFRPLGNIPKKESDPFTVFGRVIRSELTPTDWDYLEFYRLAKEHGAYVDLFEVDGKVVILSEFSISYYPDSRGRIEVEYYGK